MPDHWLYIRNSSNTARFLIGEKGPDPVLFIGINPSVATPEKPDATLNRVKRFSELMGYHGWAMINLYPQRSTNPKNLHKRASGILLNENLRIINDLCTEMNFNSICASWGNLIEFRPYLIRCLYDICEMIGKEKKWIKLGSLTRLKHPRHPSRLGYDVSAVDFDINQYLLDLFPTIREDMQIQ